MNEQKQAQATRSTLAANNAIDDATRAVKDAMRAILDGPEIGAVELRRVTKLAKLAQDLRLETAEARVGEFIDADPLRPLPIGGRPLADNVELFRNLSATLEDQETNKNRDRIRQADAKQLEALINMKIHGMDQDKDMEEIYALVRTNVLRRLQAHAAEEQRASEDSAASQPGDEGRGEAPHSLSVAGGHQPVG